MNARRSSRSRGWWLAFVLCAACTVPKLGDLGQRGCNDEHRCAEGYTCVDEACVPGQASNAGFDADAGRDGGMVADGGLDAGSDGGECDGGPCDPTGAVDCSPGSVEACDPGGPECGAGTRTCGEDRRFGACVSEFATAQEICNGVDDNCDGVTDQLLDGGALVVSGSCALTEGVCAGGVRACVSGSFETTCSYGAQYEMIERACDGLDNDCDGRVDVSKAITAISADGGVVEFDWALADEGFRVVYLEGQVSSRVMFQRFDPDWKPLAPAVRVATTGWGAAPKIAVRGSESVIAYSDFDPTNEQALLFIARVDAAGNQLFTEGGGSGHPILVQPTAPEVESGAEVAYSADGQSIFVFWVEETGIMGRRYSLDGVQTLTRTLVGNLPYEMSSTLTVAARDGGFLVASNRFNYLDGGVGVITSSVNESLQRGSLVQKKAPGDPFEMPVLLFPDSASAEGFSVAWMSEVGTDRVLAYSSRPLSNPGELVWNANLGFREIQLVGAAGTVGGTTFLTSSGTSTSQSLYQVHGPPASPQPFLAGEIQGFAGTVHGALWDPDHRAWWVGYVAGSSLRVARVCGP